MRIKEMDYSFDESINEKKLKNELINQIELMDQSEFPNENKSINQDESITKSEKLDLSNLSYLVEEDEAKIINYSFDEKNNEIELKLRSILESNECPIIFIEILHNQSNKDKIKNLIKDFEFRSCWLDCLEIFNFNHLFGTILIKFLNPESNLDEFDENAFNILDVNGEQNFIQILKSKMGKIKHKNLIVALDNADILAERKPNLIQFLLGINELIKGLKITTIMISNYKKDYFRNLGLTSKFIYNFELPFYTLNEIERLIILNKPVKFPYKIYSKFVNQVLENLRSDCLEFGKLRYICEKFFLEFENESNLTGNEKEFQIMIKQINFIKKNNDKILSNLVYKTNDKLNMIQELTYCGKCLLIAAYLASFNSQSKDKRFFSKFQDPRKKKGASTAFSKDDRFIGPKKFSFERLFQIYSFLQSLSQIVYNDEMKIQYPTNLLFEQFQTFISQKLIIIADVLNNSPYSSSSKYCISDFITYDFIKKLAESVEIDLDKFLEKNLLK